MRTMSASLLLLPSPYQLLPWPTPYQIYSLLTIIVTYINTHMVYIQCPKLTTQGWTFSPFQQSLTTCSYSCRGRSYGNFPIYFGISTGIVITVENSWMHFPCHVQGHQQQTTWLSMMVVCIFMLMTDVGGCNLQEGGPE